MFTRIEAYNFGCLRAINQPLDRFHVLVGSNASGKSTLLDVIGFVSDFVNEGLDAAILKRTSNFVDLVWMREEGSFRLVLEARIPEELQARVNRPFKTIRYELEVGILPNGENSVLGESLILMEFEDSSQVAKESKEYGQSAATAARDHNFSAFHKVPGTLTVVNRYRPEAVSFNLEIDSVPMSSWTGSSNIPSRTPALNFLPGDIENFPLSSWFRSLIRQSVLRIELSGPVLRQSNPAGQYSHLNRDGSNLAWLIRKFMQVDVNAYQDWLEHLRIAMPDIREIDTILREDDRHCYIVIEYGSGVRVPSWKLSDGTLRMLALTFIAYNSSVAGVFLIEEPENGIHPRVIELVTQSLESVYEGQVLIATHSPVLLNCVESSDLMCFSRNIEGATEIIRGDLHPFMPDWRKSVTLGTLFASGVLE